MLRLFSVLQIQDISANMDDQWKRVALKRRGELLKFLFESPATFPRVRAAKTGSDPRGRFSLLCAEFRGLADVASVSESLTQHLRQILAEIHADLLSTAGDKKSRNSAQYINRGIQNPLVVYDKGRPKQARLRSAWEESANAKRRRKC
jgi:hypothetical protein